MSTTIKHEMKSVASKAKAASIILSQVPDHNRKAVLLKVSHLLKRASAHIERANQQDIAFAKRSGISDAMIDRLMLNRKRIHEMAHAVSVVARLPNPTGKVLASWRRPNGLRLTKVSVPLGVIMIIYESRPNVTSECASLCLRSANAVILRGGKEAFHSNRAIAQIYRNALKHLGLPQDAVSFVNTTDRQAIDCLLGMPEFINLVIPRGGEALIKRVVRKSKIPVVKHDKGICHTYIDRNVDLTLALRVAFNAKCQRVSVCNAMETLLVHQAVASRFLPSYGKMLHDAGFEIRGDFKSRQLIPWAKAAHEKDWRTEYLDKILSIRVVSSINEALRHIQKYGSSHTDAIITRDKRAANQFCSQVDSACVMVNTSTRFSDGFEFGFGAEIGISTEKVHARGPMGLEGLMSYKYIVRGSGQIRS